VGEEEPNHIPFVRWYLLEIQEESTCCAIPCEYVPSAPDNKGRHDVRLIEHSLESRANRFALRRGIDSRLATREPKQLDPLDGIKLQHTSQVVQHSARHADRTSLLEPRVPGRAHSGQLCYFLAPQTRGSPPMRRGKADGGGRDTRPPSAQKIAQLVPSDLVVSHRVESQVSTFYTSIKNASGTGFV
jgi:hypothetical protein